MAQQQQPFIDRLGVFAANIGRMINDFGFSFFDATFLCGGDEASTKGAEVKTFQDVWSRCTKVYGDTRMNIIYYSAITFVAIIVLKMVYDLVAMFRVPASGKVGKKNVAAASKKKSAAEKVKKSSKGGKQTGSQEQEEASSDEGPTSPNIAAAAETSQTFAFAKAIIEAAQADGLVAAPQPTSQIFASPTASSGPIKASNKTFFPSRVGVMQSSPCQQYWLISCRSTLEARIYPQNHKSQFLSKGADLSKKLFLSLGLVVGPVLGTDTKVDISIASFLASTPLASIQYSEATASKKGDDSTKHNHSHDPLLFDTSSSYLVVGESQKDMYVILRLTTNTQPNAGHNEESVEAASGADASSSRMGAAKSLAQHYRTTPVRAEVLWLYRRPNHRLVWDTYRFGLFSSFACAPTARMTFASVGKPLFGAGSGAEHNLAVSLADEHAYGTSAYANLSSPPTVADILVFGNAEDCSLEMVHRAHVGDGYELTQWGSYQSTASASADKDKKKVKEVKGKGGKAAAAAPEPTNPIAAVYAEADADWHPQGLKAGQSHTIRNKNSNKFSVGHAAAMALSDPIVVCCGTFSTEPTVSQLTMPQFPLGVGSNGPSSVKDLVSCFSVDRFFPTEAIRPKGPGNAHHVSMSSVPHSIQPQRLKVPRVVPSYLAELSSIVSKVSSSLPSNSSSVSNEELLSRFVQQGSESFSRSGFAAQQVVLVNAYQPASTLSYNAAAGCHRPCLCIVFCDNGCGFVFDLATSWDVGSSAAGTGNVSNEDVLHAYNTYSTNTTSGKRGAVNPARRSADKPIASFYDLAFAKKEVRALTSPNPSSPGSPLTVSGGSTSTLASVGGCDQLLVAISGEGPTYALRIALVNKISRCISVFSTAAASSSSTESKAISFVDAPLTPAVLKAVTGGKVQAEQVVSAATTNLPANTTATPYTDAFATPLTRTSAWKDVRPLYNRYGELNQIQGCCFIQNGCGIATIGNDDGLGALMHAL